MKVYLSFQTSVLSPLLDLPELLDQVLHFLDDVSLTRMLLTCSSKFSGTDSALHSITFWQQRFVSSGVVEYLDNRIVAYQSRSKHADELKQMQRFRKLLDEDSVKNERKYIMTLRQYMYDASKFEEDDDEDEENEPELSLEISPSNRAGCRSCRKKIDQGIVRLLAYTERNEYNYYDSKEYYHIECLGGLFCGSHKKIQERIDSIRVPSGKKFKTAFAEIEEEFGKEEEDVEDVEDCGYVFVCDVCGKMNTGEQNYCCFTCSADHKKEVDYCEVCHDLVGQERHKNCKDFTEEDVLYEFNCCKCSNKMYDCMFHCQVCVEGRHDICRSCFDKIVEDEKLGKSMNGEDLTHPFFLIGNPIEESNALKRKEIDDNDVKCEPKKRKVVSLSDYLKSHDFSLESMGSQHNSQY